MTTFVKLNSRLKIGLNFACKPSLLQPAKLPSSVGLLLSS